jgi:hypothetical protein
MVRKAHLGAQQNMVYTRNQARLRSRCRSTASGNVVASRPDKQTRAVAVAGPPQTKQTAYLHKPEVLAEAGLASQVCKAYLGDERSRPQLQRRVAQQKAQALSGQATSARSGLRNHHVDLGACVTCAVDTLCLCAL